MSAWKVPAPISDVRKPMSPGTGSIRPATHINGHTAASEPTRGIPASRLAGIPVSAPDDVRPPAISLARSATSAKKVLSCLYLCSRSPKSAPPQDRCTDHSQELAVRLPELVRHIQAP